ncbi:MAG: hypothetical protein IPG85_08035 [Bacteroidetes bacterium]|nr:hypothetical protein [Bacteroidota bacterium]
MRKIITLFILILCNNIAIGLNNKTLLYIENKGQITNASDVIRNDILFTCTNNSYNTFFLKDGYSFQLYKKNENRSNRGNFDKTAKLQNIAISRVEVKFLNLNESSLLTGENKLNDYLNFITVNGEFRNVSQYEVLQYKNIYEGIDMDLGK